MEKQNQAKSGDTVQIHFSAFLDDGTIPESTVGKAPREFTIGNGQVVSGLERAVTGMKEGDSKTVFLDAQDAYGPHQADFVFTINKSSLSPGQEVTVGSTVQVPLRDNNKANALVTDISGDLINVDANHPLAGQYIIYEIKLVSVK